MSILETSMALRPCALALVAVVVLSSSPLASAQTLSGGWEHSLVVNPNGTISAVGINYSGEVGDGTTTPRTTPIILSGASMVAVAAGQAHSLALTSDGHVWAWGNHSYGQLGRHYEGPDLEFDFCTPCRPSPVLLDLTSVVGIAAGHQHSLALLANGDVYAWGDNANGQLGSPGTSTSDVPILVMTGATGISAGTAHSIVLKGDGTVWGAGGNQYGALGDGTTTPRTSFVQMSGVTTAVKVASGGYHSLVLLANGTIRAVGYNGWGNLGDGTQVDRHVPIAVSGMTNVVAVAGGDMHSLALKADGTVWGWGRNWEGELGDGTLENRLLPVQVVGLANIQEIASGFDHGLAVDTDGVVWMWGRNAEYQFGDGTTTNRLLPEPSTAANRVWLVAKPRFDPSGGSFDVDRAVTVTVETPGATIHYTRDGQEPTEADPIVVHGGTVLVDTSQTLTAKAWKSGMAPSGISHATFAMTVAMPVLSPPGGSFGTPQTVSSSTVTPSATLRYTTDGSVPTESSALYTGPLSVSASGWLLVRGFRPGWTPSETAGGYFVFSFGPLSVPVATPSAGTHEGPLDVALSSISGATIYYTTNGSTPTTSSALYTGPLTLLSTTTVKARAYHPDYSPGLVLTQLYTIRLAAPTLTVASGDHAPGTTVTAAHVDPAATIRITLTGLDPTATDPILAPGGSLLVGDFTLKAKAFKTGALESVVTAATYSLTEPLSGGVLATGGSHTALSTPSGLLYGFGLNTSGQGGDGTTTNRTAPKLVQTLTGVTALAAGQSHTLAITWDGRLFAWGSNGSGRLGDGTTTTRTSPTLISSISNVIAIAAGNGHSMALTADGLVYAWGVGTNGQLGLGSTSAFSTPTVLALTNIVAIAAGGTHSVALSSDGQLYAWGLNSSLQLGDGTNAQRTSPVLITGLTDIVAIAAGGSHSLALTESGAVYVWGAGGRGQLGLGTTNNRSTPTLIPGLTAVHITAGTAYSAAGRADGVTVAWGANASGQLGDTTTTQRLSPTVAADASDVALLSAGGTHAAEVTPDGHLWTWGAGSTGQLGDGTTSARATPQDVATFPGVWGGTMAPRVSPAPGTYYQAQTVAVTAATPGAIVRYTTTGAMPTPSDPEVPPSGEIQIDVTTTLRLRAWMPGRAPSGVVSATYTLEALAPTVDPPGGVFTTPQGVTLSTTTPGATIRYTLDGTAPSPSSTLYVSPLTIDTMTTVKAQAFVDGWSPSAVVTHLFTFNNGTLAQPVITPGSGKYLTLVTVAMSGPASAEVRYTIDASDPVETSTLYTGPLILTSPAIVKARAFRVDYTPSQTRMMSYQVKLAPPVFGLAAGQWPAGTTITATSATPGARVHYTLDGRDPSEADPLLIAAAPLHIGNFTVKARAYNGTAEPSDIVERAYSAGATQLLGQIAAGLEHSVVARPDGTVTAWGTNGPSRLLGVVYCQPYQADRWVYQTSRPIQSEATGLKTLDAGWSVTAGVLVDGQVVTWGRNDYEQLGHAEPSAGCLTVEEVERPSVRLVPGLSDVSVVDAGVYHFVALKGDGTVWAWGYNQFGQLGRGGTTNSGSPMAVTGLTDIALISAGQTHNLAVTTNGTVWAWGGNAGYQLGVVGGGDRDTPIQVTGLANPISVTAGFEISYAVLADGTVWVWGDVPAGLIPGVSGATSTPTQVPGLAGITSIATGATTAYALAAEGRIWAWGANTYGQLGDGTTTARSTPALIPGLPAIRSVSTSGYHTLAAAVDGSVWAWGSNLYDQIGDVTSQSDRLTPLPILQDTTLGTVPTETPGTLDPTNDIVRYYHTDTIGSVRVVTDATGQLVERHDYKPFGEEWNPPSAAQKPGFTRQERDTETGLDYFGARHYASRNGRFTSVDPALDTKSALIDPQRWNRYSYTWNRPLAMVDPDGREAGYVYLPGGRVLSPYDRDFPSSQYPFRDTLGLAATFVGGLFGAPLIDKAAQAGPVILAGLTRLLASPVDEMMTGRYGEVSRRELEGALNSGGPTVELFTNLSRAPMAGRALSAAGGEGAQALAAAARANGSVYAARVPESALRMLERAGLLQVRQTMMNGVRGIEYRFLPEAMSLLSRLFERVE